MGQTKQKKRRYKRKFSGKRTDTRTVREIRTSGGNMYFEREDGSNYPKLTSVPVSSSIRNILSHLRIVGHYNNYDELLLDLFEKQFRASMDDSSESKEIDKMLTRAEIDVRFRLKARNKATEKGRYRPR